MRRLPIVLALLPAMAQAQVVTQKENTPPYQAATTTTATDGSGRTLSVPVVATIGASGSSPTVASQGSSTSGQSGTLSMCAVVTGNQTYTAGTTQPLNCITTGRLKVGVSNAGNIDPATMLTTTLTADLAACKNYTTRATWADQYTGALQCDTQGNLYINNATLSPGAATAANQPAVATAAAAAPTTGTMQMVYDGTTNAYRQRGTVNGTAVFLGIEPTNVGGAATSTAYATTGVVEKASAGNLALVSLVNSTAAGFLVVANLTAVPASGTAITAANLGYCMPVAASVGFDKTFQVPAYFSTGITVLFSTSCTNYTPVGTAPILITAQFK